MTNNIVELPNVELIYGEKISPCELVLAAGGRPPLPAWFEKLVKNRTCWAIDRGVDLYYRADILPQKLIGDGDSASSAAWNWATTHDVDVAKFPAKKDYTDTQLALEMAGKQNSYIIMTGALGGRFDHAYSTIFSFGHSKLQGCIADDREYIFFLHDDESITLQLKKQPKYISLMPLTAQVSDVSIDGVYWPLKSAGLTQAMPYAISNATTAEAVNISIGGGILAVYICWQES